MKSTERNTGSRASSALGPGAGAGAVAAAAALVATAVLAIGCQTAPRPKAGEGALQGVVFDLDKAPVSGAQIELEGPSGKASALTDSQGRFTFPGLVAGGYSLSFSKSMYERRSWPVTLSDFSEAVYLQAAGYWQLLDAAMAALGKKELGEAEDYIARAKGIQDKSSTSLFLEGVLAERRGDYASAIGDLEAASASDERSPYLWLYLADLYRRSGSGSMKEAAALDRYLELRDDPAMEERKKALRSDPPGN